MFFVPTKLGRIESLVNSFPMRLGIHSFPTGKRLGSRFIPEGRSDASGCKSLHSITFSPVSEQKRGRESFLDKIATGFGRRSACHAVHVSRLEISRSMSSTAELDDSRCLIRPLTTPRVRRFWLRPTTGPGSASRPMA